MSMWKTVRLNSSLSVEKHKDGGYCAVDIDDENPNCTDVRHRGTREECEEYVNQRPGGGYVDVDSSCEDLNSSSYEDRFLESYDEVYDCARECTDEIIEMGYNAGLGDMIDFMRDEGDSEVEIAVDVLLSDKDILAMYTSMD